MTLIRKLATTAFLLAVVLVACGSQPPPPPQPKVYEGDLPANAVRIKGVPPLYAEWFGEVKECVGSSRIAFDDITWYAVLTPDVTGFHWVDLHGKAWKVAGLAYSQKTAIVLGTHWLLSPEHVRHELLHLIASPVGHNPELYMRRCAHLVACYSNCRTDTLTSR